MNLQRALILTHGFGPFRVKEVRNGSAEGIIVVIETPAGLREIAASRLAPELQAGFSPGQRITWIGLERIGSEFRSLLLEHRDSFGLGPFEVESVVPASPWSDELDLVTFKTERGKVTLESRFLVST